eukprot:CAMPEP_0117526252 /NCGR_PEP_ID=MMETSP0784-20121206/36189_1 /TAXON_ID=39447 /ORGANISM="" /LENGTH=111 /DNA_ID=CAMNT_0005322473 /DNA_START=367 /DNA_END=703 /DNA_ORIENTATION=+
MGGCVVNADDLKVADCPAMFIDEHEGHFQHRRKRVRVKKGYGVNDFHASALAEPTKTPMQASDECLKQCITAFAYALGSKTYDLAEIPHAGGAAGIPRQTPEHRGPTARMA